MDRLFDYTRLALMIFVLILVLIGVTCPGVVRAEQCVDLDYSSERPPDFNCLGPGEAELRVDLSPHESIPVRQGEEIIAPWDGALVDVNRLVEVGLALKAVRRLRWLDNLRITSRNNILMEYEQRINESRLTFAHSQRDRAAESERRSRVWWRNPVLWYALGFVSAGVLVILTAYALNSTFD